MIPGGRRFFEPTEGSIAAGVGLAFSQGLWGRQALFFNGQSAFEASIRKRIPFPDGRASASDKNESRQGGEGNDGAQYVQHVHGCRLYSFVLMAAANAYGRSAAKTMQGISTIYFDVKSIGNCSFGTEQRRFMKKL